MRRTVKTKPRRVDFNNNNDDHECALLGALGFSTRCIMQYTKLGPGQVTYRLKKAEVRRIDYRDGYSDVAMIVMRHMKPVVERQLIKHLRETLK